MNGNNFLCEHKIKFIHEEEAKEYQQIKITKFTVESKVANRKNREFHNTYTKVWIDCQSDNNTGTLNLPRVVHHNIIGFVTPDLA